MLNLIRMGLEAGYMEDWQYNRTYSGTPQGGILSPLLANIYLNELDAYIEDVLIPQYTRGKRRADNLEYNRLNQLMQSSSAERKAIEKAFKNLNSNADNFRLKM